MEYSFKDTIKKPLFWFLLISLFSISYLIKIGFDIWMPKIKMDSQKSLYLLFDILSGIIIILFMFGSKLMLKIEQIIGVFRFLFLLILSIPFVAAFYFIIGKVLAQDLNNYSQYFGTLSVISFITAVVKTFVKKNNKK